MDEVWRPVPEYEALYEVSNRGRVRSFTRSRLTTQGLKTWKGRELSPFVDRNGYLYVNLSAGKTARKIAVHVLVLSAFVGPRPDGLQACHNDGNRLNPVIGNLRWDTVAANSADRIQHGTSSHGERSGKARLTQAQVDAIRVRPENSILLAKEYGVASSTIRAVRLGQNWKRIEVVNS
jgi:hypothetical protein